MLIVFTSSTAPAKLELHGLDRTQEANVRAWLSIATLEESADAASVYRNHRRARQEITKALQALGHYKPVLKLKLDADEKGWRAEYRIEPGAVTSIRKVQLHYIGPGANDLSMRLPAPAWEGRKLDHGAYSSFKSRLLTEAAEAGYLDAEFSRSRLLIDPDQHTADIDWEFSTGPAYVFGNLAVKQDILNEGLIQRYVDIRPGERFSATRLLDLQLNLTDLDYFQQLDLDTQVDQENARVDVEILARAKAQQRYQLGGGYGTDTGPRFSLRNEFRWLNRQGHRLRNDLRIAEFQQAISSQYLIPAGRHVGSHWAIQTGYKEERFTDNRSKEFGLRLARTRVVDRRIWQYYLDYDQEDYRVGSLEDSSRLLMPGLSLTFNKSDDSLNPRRGYRLFADIHGAHQGFASSDSFLQLQFHGQIIQPLGSRSRVLLKAQLGSSLVGEISELPLSQRFFAGGDQSVRGYAYRSLAPRNSAGDVIGGKHLSVYSVEVDRLFFRDYGGALFFDFGGAADEPGKARFRGAGIGLRWRSPVGMIRADFARPLDDPDGGFRVHIGIGGEL